MVFFLSGDFFLLFAGNEGWYTLITQFWPNAATFSGWYIVFLATLITGLVIFMNSRVNYGLLVKARNSTNWFKIFGWWIEVV